jgi:hypothetical protein
MVLVGADGEATAAIDVAGIGPLGAAAVLPGLNDVAGASGAADTITLFAACAGRAVNPRCWRCKLR